MEICNDEGVWSIACSSAFEEDEKAVACRQLGFNAPTYFADLESIVIPHTETKPTFSKNLNCGSEETSLVQCLFFEGRRRKRGLISPIGKTACNQASVKCGGNCSSYCNVIYKECNFQSISFVLLQLQLFLKFTFTHQVLMESTKLKRIDN